MSDIKIEVHRKDIVDFLNNYCYFCRKQGIVGFRRIPFRMWSVIQLTGMWRRGNLTEDQREKLEEDLREILGDVQISIRVK